MNRLLFATLAVSLVGSSAALAQSNPPSDRSVLAATDAQGVSPNASENPAPEARAPAMSLQGEIDAASNRKQLRLSDPKSHCAAFAGNALTADAITWSGRCVGGLASGPGTLTFFNRGTFFQSLAGDFEKGVVLDGHVTMRWANSSSYDGDEVAGRMEGFGLFTSAEGDHIQGQWANDHPNGQALMVWANGDHYEGEWRDGKSEGRGIQTWSDGRKYDGEWRNDLPNGRGLATRKDGSRYEGIFADGHPTDVTELTAEAPTGGATAANASETVASATAGADAGGQDVANGVSPVPSPNIDELAGKKLSAVDGSTLALTPAEGSLMREIVAPGGAMTKTHFVFLSDKLGTVYEGDDNRNVAGVFRFTDTGVTTNYSDGRSETLTLNGASGVSMILSAPAGGTHCTNWFPEGHQFSIAEREAAVTEYASRLGLGGPHDKKLRTSVKPGCILVAAKPAPVQRSRTRTAMSHSPAHGKVGAPFALTGLVAPSAFDPNRPIDVPTSKVHLIDADAPTPAEVTASATPAKLGLVAGVANGASASTCLKVETDGLHWGFRNRCAYDVQFAYCLMGAADSLTSCSAGAVSGSVVANGFGSLIADQGIKETNADHDFRWVACGGGAGEVVVHLDRSDPPAGRCLRPGAS